MSKHTEVTRNDCIRALEEAKGNKTEAAKRLEIPRSTFRMKLGPTDKVAVAITIEEEHKLRRENRALQKQIKQLIEEKEKLGDLNRIVNRLTKIDSEPPQWVAPKKVEGAKDRAIITAMLSDTHFDEVVYPEQVNYVNAYNREIAEKRLRKFFENLIRMSRDFINGIEIEGLVLAMLGDMVSGNIHEELRETNEDTITNTTLHYSDLIIAGIEMLLDHFDKVFVPCVVGNHGRLDKKPRAKHRASESFDYLMYHMIARHFRNSPEVTFGISTGSDFRYTIYNTRYQLTHGDQFKGGSGIAGMLSP